MDEKNDTHLYIVYDLSVINWYTWNMDLNSSFDAGLVYLEDYYFVGSVFFPQNEIEPLVELSGSLVFRVPKMVVAHPEGITDVMLSVEGEFRKLTWDALSEGRQIYSAVSRGEKGFDTAEEAVLAYVQCMQ